MCGPFRGTISPLKKVRVSIICSSRLYTELFAGAHDEDHDVLHNVWTINIKTGEHKLLTSLPAGLVPHLSVVSSSGDDKDFLYIFNTKGQCQRLDIATNNLEDIENSIAIDSNLESVLCIQELLYLIADEKLIRLNPKLNTADAWSVVLQSGVPKGHYTVLGDKIVIIDIQNLAVSQCTPKSGGMENASTVDRDVVGKSMSVIGIGKGFLYFTEPLGSGKSVSVIEYNLSRNQAATAGFIQECPVKHKLMICWA